jgi:hypothetical protein
VGERGVLNASSKLKAPTGCGVELLSLLSLLPPLGAKGGVLLPTPAEEEEEAGAPILLELAGFLRGVSARGLRLPADALAFFLLAMAAAEEAAAVEEGGASPSLPAAPGAFTFALPGADGGFFTGLFGADVTGVELRGAALRGVGAAVSNAPTSKSKEWSVETWGLVAATEVAAASKEKEVFALGVAFNVVEAVGTGTVAVATGGCSSFWVEDEGEEGAGVSTPMSRNMSVREAESELAPTLPAA